jgi:hypothetical protein
MSDGPQDDAFYIEEAARDRLMNRYYKQLTRVGEKFHVAKCGTLTAQAYAPSCGPVQSTSLEVQPTSPRVSEKEEKRTAEERVLYDRIVELSEQKTSKCVRCNNRSSICLLTLRRFIVCFSLQRADVQFAACLGAVYAWHHLLNHM